MDRRMGRGAPILAAWALLRCIIIHATEGGGGGVERADGGG